MKTIFLLIITAIGTYGIVYLIAAAAMRLTGVPRGFPPFTSVPLLSGVAGGFIGASAVYFLIRLFSAHPNRIFLIVALVALAISFSLPLRLSFTRSKRFEGVTPAAQMTLALLHTLIATAAVTALTKAGSVS